MKTTESNTNEETTKPETWGRTDNEAYVWENDGHQEHHENIAVNSKDYNKDDKAIQKAVTDALAADNFVDSSVIEVTVADGRVHLYGKVADESEKERAENLAKSASGLDVVNQITVGSDTEEHHYKHIIHSQSASPKSVF